MIEPAIVVLRAKLGSLTPFVRAVALLNGKNRRLDVRTTSCRIEGIIHYAKLGTAAARAFCPNCRIPCPVRPAAVI